jgi:hypothetical protein
VLTLLLLSTASTAHASEPEPDVVDKPQRAESHDDLLLTGGVGAFEGSGHAGGVLSLTGLRQKGLLGYGATFEYGAAIFDYSSITAAPMIGLFADGPRWVRFGIAAAGGIHHYEGVGRGFLSSDPGASGTAPFLGMRAFLGAEVGGKARFHIGLQLALDDDLTRTRDAYTYTESDWTSPHPETTAHTVGTRRFAGMLALGTAFDL